MRNKWIFSTKYKEQNDRIEKSIKIEDDDELMSINDHNSDKKPTKSKNKLVDKENDKSVNKLTEKEMTDELESIFENVTKIIKDNDDDFDAEEKIFQKYV